MKEHYFNQGIADNDDEKLAIAKTKGYVPDTCLLGGETILLEVLDKRNPCLKCSCSRLKCKSDVLPAVMVWTIDYSVYDGLKDEIVTEHLEYHTRREALHDLRKIEEERKYINSHLGYYKGLAKVVLMCRGENPENLLEYEWEKKWLTKKYAKNL